VRAADCQKLSGRLTPIPIRRSADGIFRCVALNPFRKKESARSRKRAGGRNEIVRLNLFLFLRGECLGGGGCLGGALLEFVYAPGGVHELLRAGVKRMARVANAYDDGLLGGARLDHVTTGATYLSVHIFRMNVRLHKKDAQFIRKMRDDKGEFYAPTFHLRSSQS
jgi:hypothetical protein